MAVEVNVHAIHVRITTATHGCRGECWLHSRQNDHIFRHEPMFLIEAEDGAMFNLDLHNTDTHTLEFWSSDQSLYRSPNKNVSRLPQEVSTGAWWPSCRPTNSIRYSNEVIESSIVYKPVKLYTAINFTVKLNVLSRATGWDTCLLNRTRCQQKKC